MIGCKSKNWQSDESDLNSTLFCTFCYEKNKKQRICADQAISIKVYIKNFQTFLENSSKTADQEKLVLVNK